MPPSFLSKLPPSHYSLSGISAVTTAASLPTVEVLPRQDIIPGYPWPPEDVAGGCEGERIACTQMNIIIVDTSSARMPELRTRCSVPDACIWNQHRKACVLPEQSTFGDGDPHQSSETFKCREEDALDGCPGASHCLYADPQDCHRFFE
jgi:hypothetical protein